MVNIVNLTRNQLELLVSVTIVPNIVATQIVEERRWQIRLVCRTVLHIAI